MTNIMAARIAAATGFLAVALGAFGAHGLKELIERHEAVDIWNTAVFYQFVHAIMLFVLAGRQPLPRVPWFCFLIGIVIFSGTLYLLALTNVRWLGAITPLGGISFVAGWLWLVVSPGKARTD